MKIRFWASIKPLKLVLLIIIVGLAAGCAFHIEDWDYRSRTLKDFAEDFPKSHSIVTLIAYGDITTIEKSKTRDLDPSTINMAAEQVQAMLVSKGYEIKKAKAMDNQDEVISKLRSSYKTVMTDLYSKDIFDALTGEDFSKKSVALSTSRNLGKEAVEYAKSADADLILMFGYNGFNDLVTKTYLPMSDTPPVYSKPSMRGFATVGLIDGHTGALLWTDNGDDEHTGASVNNHFTNYPSKKQPYSINESVERALKDALITLPSKNSGSSG